MTAHEWFVEHRDAFVARTLEPDEERNFTEHLGGCAECRAEVERMERELAWLPMGVSPVAPRPGLTRTLVDAATGRRVRGRFWPIPVALAASLVLVALGWSRDHAALAAERQALRREVAMVRDTLGIIQGAAKVRVASITMGEHQGGLVIFADERTHRWNVVVYGLPAPARGEVCQFWFITDQGMVRSVEVQSEPHGPAFLTLPMPPRGGTVMGAALTLEPAGSSGDRPQGTTLAHLMM
ncbi:MAG TPA: anti-sigma factor [Gemmatimonadales bacterium]|nr:anti-sigma factor [Gemmatimonadales bacterium]